MYTLYMDMRRHILILTFGINNDKLQQGTIWEEKREIRNKSILQCHCFDLPYYEAKYVFCSNICGENFGPFFTIKRE
jgi:hypothetical protein